MRYIKIHLIQLFRAGTQYTVAHICVRACINGLTQLLQLRRVWLLAAKCSMNKLGLET